MTTFKEQYDINPATDLLDTDLIPLAQDPYGVGDDAVIDGAVLKEVVRDLVAGFLVQGTNVQIVHDDAGNTLTITMTGVSDGSVSNAKLADMAQATIKGRQAGSGTGVPEDLTAAQVITALGLSGAATADYAVGTWTPSFTFATPGNLSVSYAEQSGWYIRIGNLVIIFFEMGFTPTHTTASGNAFMTGFPFAAVSDPSALSFINTVINSGSTAWPTGVTQTSLVIFDGASSGLMVGTGSGTTQTAFSTANFATGASVNWRGAAAYRTA